VDNFQEKESQNNAVSGEVVVKSKDEARKVLNDVESLMNSAEEDTPAEDQINKQ
jgi:vacuolar-type H+-ATPase subunit E/Vma4